MRGALVFVVLVALGGECRGGGAPALPAPLLDAAADRVVARTVVPDATRKVGEVRLVQRGDAVVVQTLLATTVLPRVVAEIRKKEDAKLARGRARPRGHGALRGGDPPPWQDALGAARTRAAASAGSAS